MSIALWNDMWNIRHRWRNTFKKCYLYNIYQINTNYKIDVIHDARTYSTQWIFAWKKAPMKTVAEKYLIFAFKIILYNKAPLNEFPKNYWLDQSAEQYRRKGSWQSHVICQRWTIGIDRVYKNNPESTSKLKNKISRKIE